MPERTRLAATAAAVALTHVLFLALAWHGVVPAKKAAAPREHRVAMRLLPLPVTRHAAGEQPTAARQSVVASQRPRERAVPPVSRTRAARSAAALPAVQATPQLPALPTASPPDAPISGAVFALPRIGFGAPSSARWMSPPTASNAMEPIPAPFPAQAAALASARSAQEAGRAQLVEALLRELNDIAVPQDIAQGRCTLDEPLAALSCDPEPLREAIVARHAVLAAMLQAYRRLVPGDAIIALHDGRLRLAAQ